MKSVIYIGVFLAAIFAVGPLVGHLSAWPLDAGMSGQTSMLILRGIGIMFGYFILVTVVWEKLGLDD